jgi:hypothetical protein
MKARPGNFWFLAAAWWALSIGLGAAFTLPIFSWASIVQACRFLLVPAAALLVLGFFLKNPQRYLACLTLIMTIFVVPMTLVCLAPLASFAFFMSEGISFGHLALLVFVLMALSLWFVVMRILREERLGIKPADSYVFFEHGIAYLKLSDLQGPHTSKGDNRFTVLASPIAGLAMIGYPLQKLLVMTSGTAAVALIIAILLTPVASWLFAWMVCKFASWVLPIWRYERTHRTQVYLKQTM